MSKIHQQTTGRRIGALFATAISLLVLNSAQAQQSLPWYEPFAYPDHRLGIPGSASVGVWNLGSTGSSTDCVQVATSASLTYSGLEYTADSSGAAIGITTTTRNKGARFTSTSSGKLYNSFLMNVQTMPSGNRAIACLSTVTGGTTSVNNQSATVWINSSGQLLIAKASTTTPAATHPTSIATDTTHLVVTRYDFDVTPHQFALWLDPSTNTFGGADPGSPDIFTTAGSDQAALSSFWFKHIDGDPQILAKVDEIRVASSWAAVTPPKVSVATKLGFSTQPANAAANTTMSPVVVQIRDAYGEPIAQGGTSVTLSKLIGNGTLNGTTTQITDGTGKATFNNLSFSAAGVVNILQASASGLTNGTSDLFEITAGVGPANAPVITQALRTPGNIILRGNNGNAGQPYDVLGSTNPAIPRSSWSTIGNNTFDGSGNFDHTNNVSLPFQFFCLKNNGAGGGAASEGPNGFASPGLTGGAGGKVYIVTNVAGFIESASNDAPAIILVKSNLTLSSSGNFYLRANKTIIGIGTNITIKGDLAIYGSSEVPSPATNIIIRNLIITNPDNYGEDDGIGLKNGAHHVWVDHCTFVDCGDGMLDVTRESDFVTVSYCKFYYTVSNFNTHPNVNLIGGNDTNTTDIGKLNVTFHHNWWSTWCLERMPSVRFGKVHVYNNYFNAPGNNYCTRTRLYAELLVENNYYLNVNNPWERYTTPAGGTLGLLKATGNITNNCTWNTGYTKPVGDTAIIIPGTDTVFTPPYAYTLDAAADVPNLVTNGAGAGKGPFAQ